MTRYVQQCSMFSMVYTEVGKTYAHNQLPIFVLQVPESGAISLDGIPWPTVSKEASSR